MRFAILSDIHGNLPALQAVLADMAGRAVDRVIQLGDALSGPLLPQETAELLMAQTGWLHIRGNHERYLLEQAPAQHSASDAFAHARITPQVRDWLRGLPVQARLGEPGQPGSICICHGAPRSDTIYLLETVAGDGFVRLATQPEIADRLAAEAAELVLCGHTHVPRAVRLPCAAAPVGWQWIANPGSVGLPAYDDDHPRPHVIETGSTDARYAIVERQADGWCISLLSVPYDAAGMAALAGRNQRPDWAHALRTGYALPMDGQNQK